MVKMGLETFEKETPKGKAAEEEDSDDEEDGQTDAQLVKGFEYVPKVSPSERGRSEHKEEGFDDDI
jgi:hypothetical protein